MKSIENDLIAEIPKNILGKEYIKLNVKSYGGYAKVDHKCKELQLFYWFFESQTANQGKKNTEEIPLIIWLQGGPGAPSTLGLFLENGPYSIKNDSLGNIKENLYSWNKNAHVMYWDQPIGTGYSMVGGEDPEVTFSESEDELSEVFYTALQNFFIKHPEYINCPLYIMGESYAGKYVPNIVLKIHVKNQDKSNKLLNLKGMSVGDGWINPQLQLRIYIDYVYSIGLLDTKQYNYAKSMYEQFKSALKSKCWKDAFMRSNQLVTEVSEMGGGVNFYDVRSFSEIPMDNLQRYMELSELKRKLHVPIKQNWNVADNVGPVAEHLGADNVIDSSSLYTEIIKAGYAVLMYAAIFDTACGAHAIERILYDLPKWTSKEDKAWKLLDRKVWKKNNQVYGMIKKMNNLTHVTLMNSGHQVPYYLPEISLKMVYEWLGIK